MAGVNIREQLHDGDLQLPAELHLANGETVICTKLVHHPGRRAVLIGRWQSKPVLIKLMLDKRRGAHDASREHDGYRIVTSLNIKTPELYFRIRCDSGHVLAFEFLHAITLHDLWQSQPHRRTQIADWSVDLMVKLHRHGYRHVDFHFGNFLVVDDVFHVIDVRGIRKQSRSLRMGTLLYTSKKYGYWQRYNLAKWLSRYDPQTRDVMMAALQRGYPAAVNDPKLASAITLVKKRRAKRLAKPN